MTEKVFGLAFAQLINVLSGYNITKNFDKKYEKVGEKKNEELKKF